jgi:hypothetical protein
VATEQDGAIKDGFHRVAPNCVTWPGVCLRIPIRGLNLAHDLGQPSCDLCAAAAHRPRPWSSLGGARSASRARPTRRPSSLPGPKIAEKGRQAPCAPIQEHRGRSIYCEERQGCLTAPAGLDSQHAVGRPPRRALCRALACRPCRRPSSARPTAPPSASPGSPPTSPAPSPGRHCHSALQLTGIDCHSLEI